MATNMERPQATQEYNAPSLLDQITAERERIGARYMPTLTVKQFSERERALAELKAMLVGPSKENPQGVDYGTIPGTPKPTLYQAGAQKICAFFGYAPSYEVDAIEDWDGSKHGGEPLFYYRFTCTLMKDGAAVGQGVGSASSWESKYRYRVGKRVCPDCGQAALIEGKQWKPTDPKQWVCFAKKGGCGAKFDFADSRITEQQVGRTPNPDFADIINTVQKIACKRAYVAATLSATGASQYFTQDLEDMPPDAIGTRTSPAPGSASQSHHASQDTPDDPALTEYLVRAAKGKADAQDVFADLSDRIRKASDDYTADRAWTDATKPVNGKEPGPAAIIRFMYSVWLGVAEPKEAAV